MIYKIRDRAARNDPARYVKRLIKQGVPIIVVNKHRVFGQTHQFYNFKAVISGFKNQHFTQRLAETKEVMIYEKR